MIRDVEWRRWLAAVVRRPPVLVGVMLLVVGVPEVIIGHNKAQSYRLSLESLPRPERRDDPTQLYPKRTAADEQRAVVEAKVGYYDLLHSAGRVLLLLGFTSVLIGLLREPRRSGQATATGENST